MYQFPNATAQAAYYYTDPATLVHVASGYAAVDGRVTFAVRAAADGWADADIVSIRVQKDVDNWQVWLAAWDGIAQTLALATLEDSSGSLSHGDAVVVTATLTSASITYMAASEWKLVTYEDLNTVSYFVVNVPNTCYDLKVVLSAATVSSDQHNVIATASFDNESSYETSGYEWTLYQRGHADYNANDGGTGTNWKLAVDCDNGAVPLSLEMILSGVNRTDIYKHYRCVGNSQYYDGGLDPIWIRSAGAGNNSTFQQALTNLKFTSSGNFTAGRVYTYVRN